MTEFMALTSLRSQGTLTSGELGAYLGLTSASMTALIDRLEQAGYAHRVPHGSDRRRVLVELTPSGIEQSRSQLAHIASELDSAVANLPPDDQEVILRFLFDITQRLEQHADDRGQDERVSE
jgi:DNA-binding MarR family transcriptional regulator